MPKIELCVHCKWCESYFEQRIDGEVIHESEVHKCNNKYLVNFVDGSNRRCEDVRTNSICDQFEERYYDE